MSDARASRPELIPNAYVELLRSSRGLRREQAQAREAWFAKLAADRKDETLFELEILLKGLACFANPRNHPGVGNRQTTVSLDFRDHLLYARDGMARVVQLARALLGDKDRAFVFQRYLETAVPEDITRTKLLHAAMSQETPEASLFVLRHGFTNLLEVSAGLLRLTRLPYRLFYAHVATALREIAQSAYFNPLSALEFRPEFDRISSAQVLELIQRVPGDEAHRLVALTFLSLFRMLRYLRLLEAISVDHTDRRIAGRAYLALAVLRSDARSLSNYLRRRAGDLLAEGFERDLYLVPAKDIEDRFDALMTEGQRLVGIKAALAGVAANLRLEMRRAFEHDISAPDTSSSEHEVRARLRVVINNVRPTLQNAVLFLARSLGASLDDRGVFDDPGARRASSERLRRDVWMFAQIARAFASKARHTDPLVESWSAAQNLTFVREFLAYFRAMGYPLLSVGEYPRVDDFLIAMEGLGDADVLDPGRLDLAAAECEVFYGFLSELFEVIGKRDELTGVPFDRPAAARTLKLYLGA